MIYYTLAVDIHVELDATRNSPLLDEVQLVPPVSSLVIVRKILSSTWVLDSTVTAVAADGCGVLCLIEE